MATFQLGLELARHFYNEVVQSLITCAHTACLLGEGSEILGYDSERSTDHAWGLRLQVLVAEEEVEPVARAIEQGLPDTFRGWTVRFYSWQTRTVRHQVEVTTLDAWIVRELGFDPRKSLTAAAWLALPQQRLLQVTQGRVFHDDTGDLTAIRCLLEWYPRDVWLWMMATQWHLIGNAAPLMGRTAEASDLRGSTLVANQLVRLMMEMTFLQERQYWPYAKWFGTAFSRLDTASLLGPTLDAILTAEAYSAREDALVSALEFLAHRHNLLGLTPAVEPAIQQFEVGISDAVRPYRVLNAGAFVTACRDAIEDDCVRNLVTVGAFDQLTHADDLLVNFSPWPDRLAAVYQELLEQQAP
jgi:hypothetical protein